MMANIWYFGSMFYNIIIAIVGIVLLLLVKDVLALAKINLLWKAVIGWLFFLYVTWLFWGENQGLFFCINWIVLVICSCSFFVFFLSCLRYHSLKYVLSQFARIRWLIKTLMFNKGIDKKIYPSKFYLFLFCLKTDLKHLGAPGFSNVKFLGQSVSFVTYRDFVNLVWEIFINNAYYLPLDQEPKFIIDGGSNIGISILFFNRTYGLTESYIRA